jgi:hypothetical protein
MGNTEDEFTPIQIMRCRCTMLRPDAQFDGHLSLDDKFLFFRAVPPGPGTRPIAWELPRTAVDHVTLSDDEFFLELTVGSMVHRFRGVGLEPIYRDLKPNPRQGLSGGSPVGRDDEPLLKGGINLFVNKFMSARGQVTLSESELIFAGTGGIEASLWKNIDKHILVCDITDIAVVGIRRQLVITTRTEKLVFGGALAHRLYGVLLALRGDTVTISGNQVLFTWSVSLHRGAVALSGELIGSSRRIRFVPSGRIDAIFGLDQEIAIRIHQITRVEVRGLVDKRLVITGAGHALSFQLDEPQERFEDLKDFLVEIDHESEPTIPETGATQRTLDTDELVEQWQQRLRFLDAPALSLLGVVLDLSRPGRARRGWLGIFARKIVFLPVGSLGGGEAPLVVNADDISRAAQGAAPQEHLYLGVGDTTLRFLPRGGDEFAELFWSLWQPLVERTPVASRLQRSRERAQGYGDAETFNRRDTYRANAPHNVTVSLRTKGQGVTRLIEARFADLGPEGCALTLGEELPKDAMVKVQLPDWALPEEDAETTETGSTSSSASVPGAPVPARVVYSKRLRGERFRHGLCFHDLNHHQDQAVRKLYMLLQREERGRERHDVSKRPKGL